MKSTHNPLGDHMSINHGKPARDNHPFTPEAMRTIEIRVLLNDLDSIFAKNLGMNLLDAKIMSHQAMDAISRAGELGAEGAYLILMNERPPATR